MLLIPFVFCEIKRLLPWKLKQFFIIDFLSYWNWEMSNYGLIKLGIFFAWQHSKRRRKKCREVNKSFHLSCKTRREARISTTVYLNRHFWKLEKNFFIPSQLFISFDLTAFMLLFSFVTLQWKLKLRYLFQFVFSFFYKVHFLRN